MWYSSKLLPYLNPSKSIKLYQVSNYYMVNYLGIFTTLALGVNV